MMDQTKSQMMFGISEMMHHHAAARAYEQRGGTLAMPLSEHPFGLPLYQPHFPGSSVMWNDSCPNEAQMLMGTRVAGIMQAHIDNYGLRVIQVERGPEHFDYYFELATPMYTVVVGQANDYTADGLEVKVSIDSMFELLSHLGDQSIVSVTLTAEQAKAEFDHIWGRICRAG